MEVLLGTPILQSVSARMEQSISVTLMVTGMLELLSRTIVVRRGGTCRT
jgi:hypothetical protein